MIERRYPIQSVLAERKMFANGGMVSPPMQQPMQQPMQPMPMQQPMQPMQPQQPQGIMASSQPLVDAIAADALNPQGGGTLSGDPLAVIHCPWPRVVRLGLLMAAV